MLLFMSKVKEAYRLQEVRFCYIGYEGPYTLTECLRTSFANSDLQSVSRQDDNIQCNFPFCRV